MVRLTVSVIFVLTFFFEAYRCQDSESAFRNVENCQANKMYDPVCGTDGSSYINMSYLKCAQKLDSTLEVASNGRCPSGTVPQTRQIEERQGAAADDSAEQEEDNDEDNSDDGEPNHAASNNWSLLKIVPIYVLFRFVCGFS